MFCTCSGRKVKISPYFKTEADLISYGDYVSNQEEYQRCGRGDPRFVTSAKGNTLKRRFYKTGSFESIWGTKKPVVRNIQSTCRKCNHDYIYKEADLGTSGVGIDICRACIMVRRMTPMF